MLHIVLLFYNNCILHSWLINWLDFFSFAFFQAVLAGSQVASGTHAGIYLRPSDIGCQYSRSIYTACFIVWQPHHAADTSPNWRQSLFCCCTTSMEQATDGAETAAIDGLVLSWSENIYVSFCLRAPRYRLTLWYALGLLVGGTVQVPQLQLHLCWKAAFSHKRFLAIVGLSLWPFNLKIMDVTELAKIRIRKVRILCAKSV